MLKRVREWLYTFNLTVLLTLNLFLIIAAVLGLVALCVVLASALGWADWTQFLSPSAAAVVLYSICILIGISMVVMIRKVILEPVRGMVSAMQRLASGDFSVRMVCKGSMRPLELREFTEAFNTAAAELGGTEMLRKDFVRNFSHEFKTPITSLGGFADLLLEDEDMPAGERREYLKIISDESRRLAGLANSVLALSRVESQTILTDVKPFNLTEQLRQTVLQIQHKWAAKHPDIRLDAEECTYTGNEALLREVWVNLLDNAVKFSTEGGAVDVRLRRTQSGVTVTVTDSGPGMDGATLARAFDRFYQGDTSHRTEGNGLGLAMVKQIVALHKGAVTAANEPGRGSTFTVTL